MDNFCIFFTGEYSFEIDDFSNFLVTFGDVPIKLEQTRYQNETLHSLVQRHLFASNTPTVFPGKISSS